MDRLRHSHAMVAAMCLLVYALGCSPAGEVGDKHLHPDQVLFERGMNAAEQEHFAVAHLTLETLINTYPDSEYADKAKLALRDPQIARCGDWTTAPGCEMAEPEWP